MEAMRAPPVLIVHPQMEVAQRYAAQLVALGFTTEACDSLADDYDHRPLSALVIFGSLQWWVGVDSERAMPPTVLVGGDSLGLARAAGATRLPEAVSAEVLARSLRSLLRLSRHSRGRGTMPMRLSSPFIVKVGRWMTAGRRGTFDEELETRRGVRFNAG
jgi:hypothetical protein